MFADYPAVEWTLKFQNRSANSTPIVSDVHALDAHFWKNQTYTLHYAQGVAEGIDARIDDFQPIKRVLPPNTQLRFAPQHGRPSWGDSLPFFNIATHEHRDADASGCHGVPVGVVLGIGWTGQWQALFVRDTDSLNIRAGMEQTRTTLRPGEEIRTPKILLLFWQGHRRYGQNLLRRMILDYYHPQRESRPLRMPLIASSAGLYREAFEANEQNQLEFSQQFDRLGIESIWLDVGWHDLSKPHTHIGPSSPTRFPHGLRSLTAQLRQQEIGLLVWFAPEFLGGGSWIEREYPELFLTLQDPVVADQPLYKILNFADRDAQHLITNHLATFIQREGIGIFRQDGPVGSNLPYPHKQPLQWWRDNDPPNRQGMTEIRYVEGMYRFWDELRKRNPKLVIDLCGGGATRIDLESMSRCVYLWRSDHNHPGFEPNGQQSKTLGVSQWVPSTGTASGYPDRYSFRSAMNNGLALAWNPYQPDVPQSWSLASPVKQRAPYKLKQVPRTTVDGKERTGFMPTEPFPWEVAERLTDEFHRVRHFFYKDFYPLTPYSVSNDSWLAYQFHDPECNAGMVLAFRREDNPSRTQTVSLWGLTPTFCYDVKYEDLDRSQVKTGAELAVGLEIRIPTVRGSQLITYAETVAKTVD